MNKWILFFSTFILTIALSFAAYLYLYRAEFTSLALSRLYGVPVEVAKVRVTAKDLEFQKITISSPNNSQPALTARKVKVKITPIYALFAMIGFTPTELEKVTIQDPSITLEPWQDLLPNMEHYVAHHPSKRLFSLKSCLISDLAIQSHNKTVSTIHTITLSRPNDGAPQSLPNLIYTITKHAVQTAQNQHPTT